MNKHEVTYEESDASFSTLLEQCHLLKKGDRLIVHFPEGADFQSAVRLTYRLEQEGLPGIVAQRDTAQFYNPGQPLKAGTVIIDRKDLSRS